MPEYTALCPRIQECSWKRHFVYVKPYWNNYKRRAVTTFLVCLYYPAARNVSVLGNTVDTHFCGRTRHLKWRCETQFFWIKSLQLMIWNVLTVIRAVKIKYASAFYKLCRDTILHSRWGEKDATWRLSFDTLLRVDEGRSTAVWPAVTCTSIGTWSIVEGLLRIHFVLYQMQVEGGWKSLNNLR